MNPKFNNSHVNKTSNFKKGLKPKPKIQKNLVKNYMITDESFKKNEVTILKKLIETFPKTFSLQSMKPLAKKIHIQIKNYFKEKGETISSNHLFNFLKRYCALGLYRQSILNETHRVDLNGLPTEPLTFEEKKIAQLSMDQYKKYLKKKSKKQEK